MATENGVVHRVDQERYVHVASSICGLLLEFLLPNIEDPRLRRFRRCRRCWRE